MHYAICISDDGPKVSYMVASKIEIYSGRVNNCTQNRFCNVIVFKSCFLNLLQLWKNGKFYAFICFSKENLSR